MIMINSKKQVTNSYVAEQLALMGQLLEVSGGDKYRARAYLRAARQIKSLSFTVAGLNEEALIRIPGIGSRISEQIQEIAKRGSFRELEDLQAIVPESVVDLLNVSGVGPKTLYILWTRLGIQTIDDLEAAVKGRRLRALRGFGAKREEAIGRGIRRYRRMSDHLTLTRPKADVVLEKVEELLPDGGYTVAGDYRRGTSTLAEIEVVTLKDQDEVMSRMPADAVISERSISFYLNGIQINVRFSDLSRYGTALLCATGSTEFLAQLARAAEDQGYMLEADGLLDIGTRDLETFESEEEIFEFLRMEPIPPELREGRGEIELALSRSLPDLVEISDLRGDLHTHTTASDGHQSLEDVAEIGDRRGYEYIVITDHSSRVSPRNLEKQRIDIERVNRRHTCQLLTGTEVDIRSDGNLGYPDSVLKDLDLVIASVHSRLDQDPDTITRRVLNAMDNEHVDIIGHPTGRLLGRRPPSAIDLDRVIDHAAATGTALEINASPHRLDLEDIYVWQAKKKGVKLAIGSDAHRMGEFANIRYGVMMARRGWCTCGDLVNSLTLSNLLGWVS